MGLVYLDNNATTQIAPEVLQAMLPYLRDQWGNPSSAYSFGHQVGAALDEARERLAALIQAEPREIIFTGCGTEGINSSLHSALLTQPARRHIVTTAVEHSATMKCCLALQERGVEITWLPVDSSGLLDPDRLRSAIRADTALVSVMWANNETGMIFPISEIAGICRAKGVLFHTDAVQAAGKVPVNVRESEVDYLSLSAHKLYAPKGVGALYIRRGARFHPHIIGGGQERGRRGGTENVPGIVAFGRAAELAIADLPSGMERAARLRNRLEEGILAAVPGTHRNGAGEPRLPNTSNVAFDGVEAEGVLLMLDQEGICASSGSACTTGSLEPSHVLTAMGVSAARARGSLRFSLGRYSTEGDIEQVLRVLPGIIAKLRKHAPAREPVRPSGRGEWQGIGR